jgi:hypothetical protein
MDGKNCVHLAYGPFLNDIRIMDPPNFMTCLKRLVVTFCILSPVNGCYKRGKGETSILLEAPLHGFKQLLGPSLKFTRATNRTRTWKVLKWVDPTKVRFLMLPGFLCSLSPRTEFVW